MQKRFDEWLRRYLSQFHATTDLSDRGLPRMENVLAAFNGSLGPLEPASHAETDLADSSCNNSPQRPPTPPEQQNPSALPPSVVDVFDIAGFMDGTTELFRSSQPGHYLRLVADRQSGVLTTLPDAPVQIKLEPKNIRRIETVSVGLGQVCMVIVIHHPTGAGAKVWTMMLEEVRYTITGHSYGKAHAKRLCERLMMYNDEIVYTGPRTELDGVRWQFDDVIVGGPAMLWR